MRTDPDWTLVTGYFDLTVEPDAGPELLVTPPEFYLEQHCGSVLSIERDLVVFTEERFVEKIWAKRPIHLHRRTRVVAKQFSDFPLFRHRERIWANRGGHTCQRDPRNTGSFYLVCMSKFAMLEEAVKLSGSTHFAWMDISIGKLGGRNVASIDAALAVGRDRFSNCRIAYKPPPTSDMRGFFGGGCHESNHCGGCTFCGTFFTVGRPYVAEVCRLAESEFVRLLEAGYGHVDEQVMAFMHGARPDLFDWYLGDYAETVTNYDLVQDRPGNPIENLLLPSIAAHDWDTAKKAIGILWRSYGSGSCRLSEQELDRLVWATREVGRQ